jgi:hypothetical protein
MVAEQGVILVVISGDICPSCQLLPIQAALSDRKKLKCFTSENKPIA